MKKITLLIMILALICTCFVGCGDKSEEEAAAPSDIVENKEEQEQASSDLPQEVVDETPQEQERQGTVPRPRPFFVDPLSFGPHRKLWRVTMRKDTEPSPVFTGSNTYELINDNVYSSHMFQEALIKKAFGEF